MRARPPVMRYGSRPMSQRVVPAGRNVFDEDPLRQQVMFDPVPTPNPRGLGLIPLPQVDRSEQGERMGVPFGEHIVDGGDYEDYGIRGAAPQPVFRNFEEPERRFMPMPLRLPRPGVDVSALMEHMKQLPDYTRSRKTSNLEDLRRKFAEMMLAGGGMR